MSNEQALEFFSTALSPGDTDAARGDAARGDAFLVRFPEIRIGEHS